MWVYIYIYIYRMIAILRSDIFVYYARDTFHTGNGA